MILVFLFLFPAFAHAFCFEEAGTMYGISPQILWSIAKIESDFNPAAIHWNDGGKERFSVGLMQINSWWYEKLGHSLWMQLGEPCTNVKVGAWILAQCIQRHGYTWEAVGCYNAKSPGKRAEYANKVYGALYEYAVRVKKVKPMKQIEDSLLRDGQTITNEKGL